MSLNITEEIPGAMSVSKDASKLRDMETRECPSSPVMSLTLAGIGSNGTYAGWGCW